MRNTNRANYFFQSVELPYATVSILQSGEPGLVDSGRDFSEARFGAGNRSLSQARKQVNFSNFQLKKSQNMDENPNFTPAETYDKIAMRKTFLSEGKHHGSLVDNFSFAAHRDCATFALRASL